jgi:predicted O-linked N-acetylglucosamine transferase (SPINDLY family)
MDEQQVIDRSFQAALEAYRAQRLDEAAQLCAAILDVQEDHADAVHLLGLTEFSRHRLTDAIELIRRAIEMEPGDAQYHASLGLVLAESGNYAAAIAAYLDAIAREPTFAEAHFNLGIAYRCADQPKEAIASFARALEFKPEFPQALNGRGDALRTLGRLDEAMDCYRRVLQVDPDNLEAHNNLGVTLKDLGQVEEAIASLEQAIAHHPDCDVLHSNRLYSLHFRERDDPQSILQAHLRWNAQIAAPLLPSMPQHSNDPDPDRRLRIGYVSADFREHCQAMFTIPLLSRHNHSEFEIFCYSGTIKPDHVTCQMKEHADVWRATAAMNDEQLSEMIRQDQIDVLVDLTQHMGKNRLLTFARKPAPVQVAWLGYPGTTGLAAMDYRLTDPYLDPPGVGDENYSERSLRLPETFWCYDPRAQIEVNSLPADDAGCITFGCLNNFCKVNDRTLSLWSQVLGAVADSRLILLAPRGAARSRVLKMLDVDPARVVFQDFRPRIEYLKSYHAIDLCLDTFPYNGHTTSLDAFWMGVPVVSLYGKSAVSRAGLSQASNLGLPHLAVGDADGFVHLAVQLAQDRQQLRRLRATLRDRMIASPLMDARRFTRNVESAYREAWRIWCRKQASQRATIR